MSRAASQESEFTIYNLQSTIFNLQWPEDDESTGDVEEDEGFEDEEEHPSKHSLLPAPIHGT